ncbi:WhiB family transcriptional regulator [Actinomycetaceae bacterium WB03_NA08]|uniref:Transcriptional regulator WhiB n=1 Tax=Scrofimicrobium canadense TaxID=2652290 RepID=A0A6N7VU70_9ACTO|nr:WhiB family transcriptional regulator [Scrofimicrobium canadense]MSS84520.1 WhiB family transcriptional regulator [Scrofimicrobium canadense]
MSEWTTSALCAQVDAELFFPPDGMRGEKLEQWEHDARQVCRECPVRRECLDEAMRHEHGKGRAYRHGMWGGLTPEQRISLELGVTLRRLPLTGTTRKCAGENCARVLRPGRSSADDYPGTWENRGHGMCPRCCTRYYRTRRAQSELGRAA